MTTATMESGTRGAAATRAPVLGIAGRTAIAGAVAGGILSGGFLLAALTVAGRMRSSDLMGLGTILYLAGAALGLLHGAVLGWLGRDEGVDGGGARRQIAVAVLYLPLPLACGWAVAGWIATVAGNVLFGNLLLLVGTGFGLAAGVFALGITLRYAALALRNAYGRWPERVTGSAVAAGAFVLLLVAFLALPAAAPGGVAPTTLGAVLAAGAITVWLVAPAAAAGLRRRGQRR